ncbi:hypothetical protein T552_01273 [Pneumocystis carinii B80]|uniref:ER membrane protein complex subunit 3 n=1 Tax=Pneumocystis carinii (strain B80) TaxID=1408658 RepID=A0A0W4ZLZ7_PNEC8|nr:hypothetical protein T552_01273 [Pneumocystis carinii B80]KTW29318.1 hypothetical protein T552_01273 [Pneumocystis carinii B80]
MDLKKSQDLYLDKSLRDWVLFSIFIVMIITGVLKHYISIILLETPRKMTVKEIREIRALQRSEILRVNSSHIGYGAFYTRKIYLTKTFSSGEYLENPELKGSQLMNPMVNVKNMDQMMRIFKSNMANIIPQTIIMAWINFFFNGFILIKLPFPLTLRFKSMLQSGVATNDLDVSWVSSLSWYFLNFFGLKPIYDLILGDGNYASGGETTGMGIPVAGMIDSNSNMSDLQSYIPSGSDPDKLFSMEIENLELVVHEWILKDVEDRILEKYENMDICS